MQYAGVFMSFYEKKKIYTNLTYIRLSADERGRQNKNNNAFQIIIILATET